MSRLGKRRANPKPANLVGSRVRTARANRGLSQAECAQAVQAAITLDYPDLSIVLDQSDISRLESGQRPVWDYELKAISIALSVSADYLLGLIGEDGPKWN